MLLGVALAAPLAGGHGEREVACLRWMGWAREVLCLAWAVVKSLPWWRCWGHSMGCHQ